MAEAEITTVARPYSRAVFSAALDSAEGLSGWSDMLALLAAVIVEQRVAALLDNPRLTRQAQAQAVLQLTAADLTDAAQNLVRVLADNGRLQLLPVIRRQFEVLKANHERTVDVQVTTAYDLDQEQQAALASALQTRLGRQVRLESTVDTGLIGGVLVRTEDLVIDHSIRGRLSKLAHAMNS